MSRTTKSVRFGIRQITYELSLFDHAGHLRRVEYRPGRGPPARRARLRRRAPLRPSSKAPNGWVASLTPAGRTLPRSRHADDATLVALSRDPRQRRAHRRARRQLGHGRFTQAHFARASGALLPAAPRRAPQHHSQLGGPEHRGGLLRSRRRIRPADLNDFWESTQDFQLEAQDPALFLKNARRRDLTLSQSSLDRGVVRTQRGRAAAHPERGARRPDRRRSTARATTPGSSNRVNLQDSGPYNYRPGVLFHHPGAGFSVEVGTPPSRRWRPSRR